MLKSTTSPAKRQTRKPVYSAGRKVGEVVDDCFVKRVSASRHFLHRPPAIAFDVIAFDSAVRLGARRIEVTDTDSGDCYEATVELVQQYGFPVNRGFGEQLALHLHQWRVTRANSSGYVQLTLGAGSL